MKTNIFEAFSKTSSGRRASTLLATHAHTPAQLFNAIRTDVVAAIPRLIEGKKYSTEKLCSQDTWSPLYKAERRVAGMCLAFLVKVGAIPLTLHRTRSGKGTKSYQLPFVKAGVVVLLPTLRASSPMTVAQ